MARIAGINIPMNKHIVIGLTHIFGIGRQTARDACEVTGVAPTTKTKDLTEAEVTALRAFIARVTVEGDLRRDVAQDIRRKMEINCLQGVRHRKGLPVRGQRTRTNARTRKGPKRTVAGKKKATK